MEITRIQIEGGFLNGFDLKPSPGLNVLIGARGTGKTSVIELLRYALGARNHTTEAQNRSLDHARAVLDGGEISVHLGDFIDEVVVTRSASDERPSSSHPFMPPIVLSQTEIETLGLSESGRLNLLDSFIASRSSLQTEEASAIAAIKAVHKEMDSLRAEANSFTLSDDEIEKLKAEILSLQQQQAQFQASSQAMASKQKTLNGISEDLSQLSVSSDVLMRFKQEAEEWSSGLSSLLSGDFGLEKWDGAPEKDPLAKLRPRYKDALNKVQEAFNDFSTIAEDVETNLELTNKLRLEVDKRARAVRAELEAITQGAGATARLMTNASTKLAQAESRKKMLAERKEKLKQLQVKRNDLLAQLDITRQKRYQGRADIAKTISDALSPHVKIEVFRAAQFAEYAKAITNALRGSGMKYADLANIISQTVSPRELTSFVESGDFETLANLIDVPKDRAARLLGNLSDFGVSEIITCSIEDGIRLTLLDGTDYKDVTTLSAGQRCTVILSIVLQHRERILIIDQPEDHLDNAFIASTVIKALRERKGLGQVILSTHNANIPVLGEANLVVELTSDGRNGFIQIQKPLAHPDAVDAITNVMEGGRDAFASRAKFYNENQL